MEEFVVYILFSEKHNKNYVGYTSNFIERFKSHNLLATKGYTIKFSPWKMVHVKFYTTKKEVLQREKYFKTGKGRENIIFFK